MEKKERKIGYFTLKVTFYFVHFFCCLFLKKVEVQVKVGPLYIHMNPKKPLPLLEALQKYIFKKIVKSNQRVEEKIEKFNEANLIKLLFLCTVLLYALCMNECTKRSFLRVF